MSFYFQPPDLAEFPRRSYRRFLEETLGNLFAEISPVASEFSPRFELSFVGADGKAKWKFEDYAIDSGYPTSPEHARKTNMTHARRMLMEVWLRDTQTGELRKSTAYMADVPVITDRGTFVINGTERVVLGQLVRAPGIYYSSSGPTSFKALMLAEQGAPVSFELELDPGSGKTSRAKCRIKLPKRGWVAATSVLTAMGIDLQLIQKRIGPLLERNRIDFRPITVNEALAVVGRAWKPDGGGGTNSGITALKELTDKRRYSLGKLGRRRVNAKLKIEEESLQMTQADLLAAVEYLLGLPLGLGHTDNIDSLENRHLRGVGEILTRAVRPALAQMSRSIKTRLELNEDEEIGSPNELVDTRPFANAITKFFAGNPLVQYLDQQNPLSELSHRRRITSFGPGGIDPNAAPVEMRDVHPSQIGRVCLVESPEGKNCGMVSYLATFCRIDDDGFMTVPYRKVFNGIVSNEVQFLSPADDKRYTLAPPDTQTQDDRILGPLVSARRGEKFIEVTPEEVDMIGIAPQGFISVGSGLIPFLEHDDANRALMGGGMMRQTLPLVRPERPRVGTGMEKIVGRSSGHAIAAKRAGTVTRVTGNEVIVTQSSGEPRYYPLIRFDRTNQNTILDQRPAVKEGQKVDAGQIIADGPGIDNGELALGRNLLVAFLPWRGYNFEDAIVVREGLVKDQKLTHIEIEKHSIGVHQTLRGPEILTPELPNVANKDLEHLDERGIAKIGSYVNPGDILVAKLSPKEQRALSAEEELLQAIFGKVAEEMADTSLRVPHGSGGRVIDVRIFTPETTPELKAGIICEIEVLIARLCPVEVGDKLAGRHGNKGIVSIIVPDCDMPYLPDGTPVDICLNPLGVPSRMNVGQVFDTQLGLYSSILNRYYRIHQFDESLAPDATYNLVKEALKEVRKLPGYEWLGENGKVQLFDGKTGEPFDRPVLVGRQYMLKLNQLVLHKINARSGLGGPYAAVTQQPVGGKANHGGQRMGEMEVWAIQAYGAANMLNEMMTIKADDIQGRHQSYADIVQGKNLSEPGRTAAFDGLCCEIRGLGMEVTLGKIVDSFEPVEDKTCSTIQNPNQPPKTLEEEYQVSKVHKLEDEEGVKMLEIPAGDFVPVVRPPVAPIITSVTNGRNGIKPKVEVSQEPLIEDVESEQDKAAKDLLSAFIDAETQDILSEDAKNGLTQQQLEDEEEDEDEADYKSPFAELTVDSLAKIQTSASTLESFPPNLLDLLPSAKPLKPAHVTAPVETQPVHAAGEHDLQADEEPLFEKLMESLGLGDLLDEESADNGQSIESAVKTPVENTVEQSIESATIKSMKKSLLADDALKVTDMVLRYEQLCAEKKPPVLPQSPAIATPYVEHIPAAPVQDTAPASQTTAPASHATDPPAHKHAPASHTTDPSHTMDPSHMTDPSPITTSSQHESVSNAQPQSQSALAGEYARLEQIDMTPPATQTNEMYLPDEMASGAPTVKFIERTRPRSYTSPMSQITPPVDESARPTVPTQPAAQPATTTEPVRIVPVAPRKRELPPVPAFATQPSDSRRESTSSPQVQPASSQPQVTAQNTDLRRLGSDPTASSNNDDDEPLFDFPSLAELEALASELTTVTVKPVTSRNANPLGNTEHTNVRSEQVETTKTQD